MKLQTRINRAGRLVCLAILFGPFLLQAEPVGRRMIDEAVDISDANTMRLEVRFMVPVNFLWYFPHSEKDDFLIAIRPIPGLGDYTTPVREHIRIPGNLTSVIKDLYYDGSMKSDHFIVLETNQDVGVRIRQGHDMKSIVIEFTSISPKPAGECGGEPKTRKPGSGK